MSNACWIVKWELKRRDEMSQTDKRDPFSAAPASEESIKGLPLAFDGSGRRRAPLVQYEIEERVARREGKLSAHQIDSAARSRRDGQSFTTEAEWTALADSALFDKAAALNRGRRWRRRR